MLQPPISLSPKRFSHSHTSAHKKESHAMSTRASSTGAPTSRHHANPNATALPPSPSFLHVGGVGAAPSKKRVETVSHESRPVQSTGAAAPDDKLVYNLKQQIQCLELEVRFLKNGSGGAAAALSPSAATITSGGAGRLDVPTSATSAAERQHALLNATIGSQQTTVTRGGTAGTDELLRRAEALEQEVADLRHKYAQREQQHQLEVAALRQASDRDSRAVGHHRSVQDELQRREAQVKQEAAQMRSLHAQEVVALQRTVERLQLEQQNAQSHIAALIADKETNAKEILSLRDAARTATTAADTTQKQLAEAMIHLTTEQGARRAAELRELKWIEDANAAAAQSQKLERSVAELSDKLRQSESDAQNKAFEVEQLKLTVLRQKEDLSKAASEAADAKSKSAAISAKFGELEDKLAKAAQGLVDLQAEREFFRLQADRLKVENSVLDVKAAQFEQSLFAERASVAALERQLCHALDQCEQLRREARAKEDVYRGIDHHSSDIRVQLRLVSDERDLALKRLGDALDELHKLRSRLDHVKHLEDQERAGQQLQHALQQLAKSKSEMQAILSQQQRVADEFTHLLVDMPEVAAVTSSSKTFSPSREHGTASTDSPQRHHTTVEQETTNGLGRATTVDGTVPLPVPPSSLATSSASFPPPPAVAAAASDSSVERMSAEQVRRELDEIANRIHREEAAAAAVLQRHESS